MSTASARHFQTRESERAVRRREPERDSRAQPRSRARASAERRRRERHFARRRRDLLEDLGLAFVLTVVLISVTAGLGVVALLEVPLAAGLLASVVLPRIRRHRQRTTAATRSGRRR